MKKAVILISTVLAIAACSSEPESQLAESKSPLSKSEISISFGSYTLVDSPEKELAVGGCTLTLDMDIINGPTGGSIRLGNGVLGLCPLFIDRDEREYKLVSVEDIGCGSKVYHGIRVGVKSTDKIALTDHRRRLCHDLIVNSLQLEETTEATKTWYSPSPPSLEDGPGQMTCMAYWEGFEIDPATNTCQSRGASGCSSPFRFETANECSSFFRID